ncbi:MAG: hypothetical protein HY898_31290 [Deltaproteobacteria bacterium]|nr:hypothetical protein [Deltaproteobacteria bacterium]
MPRHRDRVRALLILAALFGPVACGPAARVQPPATGPIAPEPIKPVAVPDDQVASAVHQLVLDGSESAPRQTLLVSVVRKLFSRAAERFDAGDDQRGLATLTGALYLVRAGELRPEMFDATAARAFERALDVVAPAGDEARSLAFLSMQSGSLPKDAPAQGQILEHLRALQTWLRDTRNRSEVENASADQRTYGELSMVQPTPENVAQGVKSAERWVAASIDFNAEFKPGIDNPKREQLVEAYRGIRTGALVIAALYLRHGDAAAASKALEGSEARRITPPGLLERLDSAAHGTDPIAWRELAALYSSAGQSNEDNISIPPEIAKGAAWGAMLEAYRRNPNAVETAVPVAEMLLRFGVAEAGVSVLADATRENKNATVTAGMLGLVMKFVLHEDQVHDPMSARRAFRAARPILDMVDALPDHTRLDPSPAQVRFAMAAVETRNGDLPASRALLEQGLKEQFTVRAGVLLADILHQSGDSNGALATLTKALSAPDAGSLPIARADAYLLAMRIHRDQGALDQARRDLAQALTTALEARSATGNPHNRALAERLLARVAFYYGDRAAMNRAIERAFEAAGQDKGAGGMVAIEASSNALLVGDVAAGRAALAKAREVNIDEEDLVYVALWEQLLEKIAKEKPGASDAATKALQSVKKGLAWTSRLAQWGLGKIDDATLLASARDLAQRTEGAFYVAMRKHASGDASALAELQKIAKGPAIQLVETHIAQEMTAGSGRGSMGAPPVALP